MEAFLNNNKGLKTTTIERGPHMHPGPKLHGQPNSPTATPKGQDAGSFYWTTPQQE